MEKSVDSEEIKLLEEIESLMREIREKSHRYKELKLKQFDSCDHFVVVSKIDRDDREGRVHLSHGCIKCGLENNIEDYSGLEGETMSEYFRSKQCWSVNGYNSDLLVAFRCACRECNQVLKDDPGISNEELENIMKGERESKGKARTRKLDEPRSIWDWPL